MCVDGGHIESEHEDLEDASELWSDTEAMWLGTTVMSPVLGGRISYYMSATAPDMSSIAEEDIEMDEDKDIRSSDSAGQENIVDMLMSADVASQTDEAVVTVESTSQIDDKTEVFIGTIDESNEPEQALILSDMHLEESDTELVVIEEAMHLATEIIDITEELEDESVAVVEHHQLQSDAPNSLLIGAPANTQQQAQLEGSSYLLIEAPGKTEQRLQLEGPRHLYIEAPTELHEQSMEISKVPTPVTPSPAVSSVSGFQPDSRPEPETQKRKLARRLAERIEQVRWWLRRPRLRQTIRECLTQNLATEPVWRRTHRQTNTKS
ncbi:hypothetical protein H4R24_005610 [Coemansia sp. RSA 988]|nr:hypothetical protein H4R24_005610 [Coemansia sp. RSA 988]